MLEIAISVTLTRYLAHVRKFDKKYGSSCWSLLYQGEARLHCDECGRLRRNDLAAPTAVVVPLAAAQLPRLVTSFHRRSPVEMGI